MFKKMALFCALAGLWIQGAAAAPIGWYELQLSWRDGSFSGQMYYDSGSPYLVTKIDGSLADTAQTTPIAHVWNVSHGEPPAPWLAFTNAQGSDIDDYDAAFYLHLLDLGDSLAVDTGMDNSLYDWSQEAYYLPGQLDQSPLLSWSIRPAANELPEPGGIGLLAAGLGAALITRRRKRPAA